MDSTEPEDNTELSADAQAAADLEALAALFAGVVRVAAPALDGAAGTAVAGVIDETLTAISAQSIGGLHRHGWGMIEALVASCPNPVLVEAVRGPIGEMILRFQAAEAAKSADWEALTERYSALRAALVARDGEAAERAVWTLYQMPGPDAVLGADRR